jgi:hypothetical protein
MIFGVGFRSSKPLTTGIKRAGWFDLFKENSATLILLCGRGMAMPCSYKMSQFSIFSKGCMKPT